MPYTFKIGMGLYGRKRSTLPAHYQIYTPETIENTLEETTFWDPACERPQSVYQLMRTQSLQNYLVGEQCLGKTPSEKLELEERFWGRTLEKPSLGHCSQTKPWRFVNLTVNSFENPTNEDLSFEDSLSETSSFEEPPGEDLRPGIHLLLI